MLHIQSLWPKAHCNCAKSQFGAHKLVKDILALEKVRRRASRLALGQKRGEMEYEEHIKILNWPTLEKRRHFISLIRML